MSFRGGTGGAAAANEVFTVELAQMFSGFTWVDMPAAETELLGGEFSRWRGDLSRGTAEIAIQSVVGTRGFAGSRLRPQFAANSAGPWTSILGGDLLLDNSVTADNLKTGAWVAIPAGGKLADIFLRLIGLGGDGIVDPSFRVIRLLFR